MHGITIGRGEADWDCIARLYERAKNYGVTAGELLTELCRCVKSFSVLRPPIAVYYTTLEDILYIEAEYENTGVRISASISEKTIAVKVEKAFFTE